MAEKQPPLVDVDQSEMSDNEQQIHQNQEELRKNQEELDRNEQQIASSDSSLTKYYLKERQQLREKDRQLREKDRQLRDVKILLMKREDRLSLIPTGEEPVTKKPRTEQSFLASIRSAKEESKNDDDESDEYDDEPNPDPDPEPKLSSTRLSLPSQLQSVSTLCQMDLDVYTSRPSPNLLRRFELDAHFTRLLDNLTNLEEISLGGEVKALRLENSFSQDLQGNTLYIRSFYSDLFDAILEQKHCILIGNPGISKSWFQLYMLYRFVNDTSKRIVNIVRQDGDKVTLINLQQAKAFTHSNKEGQNILDFLKPEEAFYIVEPGSSLIEPYRGRHTIKTCITASPDERRFKEFHKKGAVKLYMPVWKLEELHIVGKDVVTNTTCEHTKRMLTVQQIEERFRRFGGIIRYVISACDDYIQDMRSKQTMAISHTKPADIYVDGDNITKTDERKSNISHFVLQYHVYMDVPNLFREFRMCYASAYVQKQIRRQMTIGVIRDSLETLRRMFKGTTIVPVLFEDVVFGLLTEPEAQKYKWKVCKLDAEEEFKVKFDHGEEVAKHEETEVLRAMKPGVLYRPVNPQFEACDMLWKDKTTNEVCVIQVTFAETHIKTEKTYKSLFKTLGLDTTRDKLKVYFVPAPRHVKEYSKDKEFISRQTIGSRLNITFLCLTTDVFSQPESEPEFMEQ